MKKISLKGLTEVLSEKELKGVMAGSGGNDHSRCPGSYPCGGTCTNNDGKVGQCMINMWVGCGCMINTW